MCFTRRRQPSKPTRIYMGRRSLPRVLQIRYLGMIFTPRLTFHAHCDRMCASAMHAAFKVTRILTKTGPPPRIVLRKLALARQIRQIRAPDEKRPTSRYAKEFKL